MIDANLIVRDGTTSGSLNALQTSAPLYVGEPPTNGHTLNVRTPIAVGSSPMLDIQIQDAATSTGAYLTCATMQQITSAGIAKQRFFTRPGRPYIRVLNTVTSGSTAAAPDFGAADQWISEGDYPSINKAVA